MKNFLRFTLPLFLFLSLSCTISKPTVYYNNEIDSSIINEIKNIENEFLKSIREKKYINSNLYLSKTLSKNLQGADQFYDSVNSLLQNSESSTRDDYYIKSRSFSISSKNYIKIDSYKVSQNFNFKFDPIEVVNNKMFITLQKYTGPNNDYLLGFIYVKENDSWKIETFNIGFLSINKNDANNWMNTALINLKNNEMFNSLLCAEIANALKKPFPSVYYEYNQNGQQTQSPYEIIQNKFMKEYKMPFVIQSIKSKPVLFQTHIVIEGFGAVPIIKYKSNFDLENISSLKKEADELASFFKKTNPTMKNNFKHIVFRSYKKIPEATDVTNHFYGVVVKL